MRLSFYHFAFFYLLKDTGLLPVGVHLSKAIWQFFVVLCFKAKVIYVLRCASQGCINSMI